MNINLNSKYQPLFRDYKDIRIILLSGGRGSGKSFAGSLWLTNKFYNSKKNALYLRKYATNIQSSVIPQFLQQVQCLNLPFLIKKNSIENRFGSKLFFMGIQSSTSSADSKLKSIPNLQNVLIEQATEITEDQFQKLNLSVRDKDSYPKIVLTFNPSDSHHWIYQKYYKNRGIPYNFNGKHDEVLYIFTTFQDNYRNLDISFLKQAESCKKYDPIRYSKDFQGKWLQNTEKSALTKELLQLAQEKVDYPQKFDKIIIAIDPAISASKTSDDTGIIVAGKYNKNYYILEDKTGIYQPSVWALVVKELYNKYKCNYIVYQSNQGGLLVEQNIRNVCGNFMQIKSVRATKGKLIRWEPCRALYQQKLVHHLKHFQKLNYQLLTYGTSLNDRSPGHMDSLTWALTSLAQSSNSGSLYIS